MDERIVQRKKVWEGPDNLRLTIREDPAEEHILRMQELREKFQSRRMNSRVSTANKFLDESSLIFTT